MKRIIAVLLTVAMILPMAIGGMTIPASAGAPTEGKYVITGGGMVGAPDYALNTTTYTGAELGTMLASTEAADSGVSFSTDGTATAGAENYVITLKKIADGDYVIQLNNGNYLAVGGVTSLVSYTHYEGVPEAHWEIEETNGVWTIKNTGDPDDPNAQDKYLGFSESAHYFRTFTSASDAIRPVLYQFVTAQTIGDTHEVSLQHSVQSTGFGSITATCSGTQHLHSEDAAAPTVFSVTDGGRMTLFFEPSDGSSLSKVRVNGIETDAVDADNGCYSLTVSGIRANTFVTAVWVTGEIGNQSGVTTKVENAPYNNTTYDLKGTASSDPLSVATVNTAAILEGSVFTDKSVQYNEDSGSFTDTLSLNSVAYETSTSGSVVIPMDVVVVLDISGSMNFGTTTGNSQRMAEVSSGLNELFASLIEDSNSTRIGLVTYSGTSANGAAGTGHNNATEILPLANYESIELTYTNQNTSSSSGISYKGEISLNAVGAEGVENAHSTQTVIGGTFTQTGIAQGYKMLEDLGDDREVTLNGQSYCRTPVFILVTDGCPTWGNTNYTSTTLDASTHGDGTQSYDSAGCDIANSAYYSILAQQYFCRSMKTLYNNNDRARYYTIGIDTSADKTYTGAQDFPKVTGAVLNPTDSAVAALSTVTDSTKFEYKLYQKMIASEYKNQFFENGHYVSYADASYDVTTGTGELEEAFRTIREEVQTLVAHMMPVVENSTVKFYDALGKDMELKSDPVLTYNGTVYSPTSITQSEGKTFYHYTGTEPAFDGGPDADLSNMVVSKEQDANGIWIVRWEVPSGLVPAYIYNGTADSYIPAPTALLSYEVGPTDAALSALSGTRTFYSNYYDEDGYHAYSTYGLNPDSPYYKTYYGSLNPTLIVSKPENTTGTDSYSGYTTHDNGTLTKLLGNNGILTVSSNTTNITAKKLWKNPDGTVCDAPDGASVTAQLWRSGGGQEDTMIGEVTLNAANEWQYSWEDLPMRNGELTYTYFGRETAVSGADAYDYSTVEAPDSTGELHISNYRNRMTVTVNTDWYYNGDKETDTYENRTVNTLYYLDSDGTPVPVSSVEPIIFDSTGDSSEDWNDSWTDLPIRNADGTVIEYVVAQEIGNEDLRGEHTTFYTVENGARASECETVTGIENPNPVVQIDNYLDNPPIKVTVSKVWADDSGSDQANITVFLYRSDTADAAGKLIQTATFGKNENWSYTFDELSSGYYYYVREARVSGYSTEYPDGSVCLAEDGSEPTVRVINTPYPTTGLAIEKLWQTDSGTALLDAGNMLPVQANVRQIDQAVTEPPPYTVTFRFIGHLRNTTTYRMIANDISINVTAGALVTLNFTNFGGLRLHDSTNTVTVMKSSGEGTLNSSSFTHTVGGTSSYRTMTYGGSLSVSDVRSDVLITVTNENVYNYSTNNFTNTGTSYTTNGGDQPVSETSENLYQTVTLSANNDWYVNLEDLPTVSVSEDGYTTHTYSYYIEEQGSSYDPVYIGNDDQNGITEGTVQIINTIYPEILPDTVVFDFGLPMDVEVLDNDRKSLNISGVYLSGVSTAAPNGVALNTGVSTAKQFSSSCKGTYGSFSVLNDKVRYTPATTDVPGIDTVYYEIFVPGVGYMYSRLDVAPATNVYFEESFLANSGYEITGTADSRVQSDANVLYGNDASYNAYEQNSLGSCYAVSVNSPQTIPEATFTFTGTGFDIISRSTPDSGVMVVEVHQNNASGATVRYFITDNYLAEDSLYQLPVVHCTDLSYGTYYVRVRAYYNAIFDHNLSATRSVPKMSGVLSDLGWEPDAEYEFISASEKKSTAPATKSVSPAASGSYNVYVDGIRIFNPLGTSPNGVGGTLYNAAKETNPEYIQIRKVLLDAGSWDSTVGGIVNPVMYIADKTSTNAPGEAFITNGVYLSTNGVLRTEEADGYSYLLDTEGNRLQYKECDVYTVVDDEGVRRYYADETELTQAQLNTLALCYYDNIYRAQGPENEAYLTNGSGIAFAVDPNNGVQISAKSPNGEPVTLCVYDGTRWIEIATIRSATEMFYDLTPYTRDSENVIVKCIADGDGILSLCQIKRIPQASKKSAASYASNEADVICAAMRALNEDEIISANHTHIREKTSDTATCTQRGTATYTCTVCGNTRTVNSPAHGHSYELELTPTVGCISNGKMVFSCTSCGKSIERILPSERHTYTVQTVEASGNEPGYILYTCTGCGFSYMTPQDSTITIPDFAELKIASAYLRLNEDINMIFSAEVPNGGTDAYMVFSFNGKESTVSDYTVDAEGRYCFAFTGITPQCMGDEVSAALYCTIDGETYTDTVASYSVKDYCTNVLQKNPENTKLQALLSDLLVYGAASQTYTSYRTDKPVTDGLELTPSTFPEQPELGSVSFCGERDADTDWTAASLVLSNNLVTRFTFQTESTDGLNIQVTLNGRTQTFTEEDFTAVSGKDNTWCVEFRGICATEFADTVSASFFRDGAQFGRTLNYSVNAYIGKAYHNADMPTLVRLVKALYNYGCSASAYAAG